MAEWSICELTFNCYAEWAEQFQVLIAGTLAILAGAAAFGGAQRHAHAAREQAKATLTVAEAERAERRRAAAAAFWAELTSAEVQLIADQKNLRNTLVPYSSMLPIRPISTPVFDGNPAAVELLPPEEAAVVTQAYRVLRHHSDQYVRLLSQHVQLAHDYSSNLAGAAERVQGIVVKALQGLRETSGISREKGDELRSGYVAAVEHTQ